MPVHCVDCGNVVAKSVDARDIVWDKKAKLGCLLFGLLALSTVAFVHEPA